MELYVMDYGNLVLPEQPMYGDGYSMDKTDLFPSYGVLIHHPEALILFDTGCPMEEKDKESWDPIHEFDDEDRVVNRLAQCGFKPEDVDIVVLSHMHSDHAGNLDLFSNAKIIVGEKEYETMTAEWDPRTPKGLFESWTRPGINWMLIPEGETKLFDGVTLYNFGPGHSFAMVGAFLETVELGTLFLASDMVYHSLAYSGHMPGAVANPKEYDENLAYIKSIVAEKNAEIWFGHDNKQFATLKKAPDFYV